MQIKYDYFKNMYFLIFFCGGGWLGWGGGKVGGVFWGGGPGYLGRWLKVRRVWKILSSLHATIIECYTIY